MINKLMYAVNGKTFILCFYLMRGVRDVSCIASRATEERQMKQMYKINS